MPKRIRHDVESLFNSPIYKSGWLYKRGEHIKTWRPRYFILLHDGHLYGYRKDPMLNNVQQETPLNKFYVTDCIILQQDKIKQHAFKIHFNDMKIERLFAASNQNDCQEWITAIESINRQTTPHLQHQLLVNHTNMLTNDNADDTENQTFTRRPQMNDFEYLKILGRGSFGKVILCRERITQRILAMKMLRKSLVLINDEVVHTMDENRILRHIRHPFITNLISAFTTSDRLCFVMECVNGGELFFHLQREKRFNEERTRFYISEIACVIGYLHSKNIIYRDIKLENILLDRFGHIKLVDFGLCKTNIQFGETTVTFCGTPHYLAPEILRMPSYTKAIDWWGVGIVMYECLVGHLPFIDNESQDGLFEKIVSIEPIYPDFLSDIAVDLIQKFLKKIPNERIGNGIEDVREIEQHPFFENIPFCLYEEKKIEPLFKPDLNSEVDTRYFDREFTDESICVTPPGSIESLDKPSLSDDAFERFTYIDSETLSHIASRSILSMTSSNITRSYPNIFYQHDIDFYKPTFSNEHFQSQYSFSTINIPSIISNSTLSSLKIKNATSMQINRIVAKTIQPNFYNKQLIFSQQTYENSYYPQETVSYLFNNNQQFQDREFNMIDLMEE